MNLKKSCECALCERSVFFTHEGSHFVFPSKASKFGNH